MSTDPDIKILRRLHLPTGPLVPDHDQLETQVALVLDVETTGLDPKLHKIIELAIRRFRFTPAGLITSIDRPFCWREDPGEPLDPAITKLTGLTDEALAGQVINAPVAIALIKSATVCIAHNAHFDRKFVERRLPAIAGAAWACSLREIDWVARDFDGGGRILGWLLSQTGWFYRGHEATNDVDAVIQLLRHESPADGQTALAELLATASKPTWMIRAVGAHFDVKNSLKARGYRWDSDESVWWREVSNNEFRAEQDWLSDNVYSAVWKPKADSPAIRQITWNERYA